MSEGYPCLTVQKGVNDFVACCFLPSALVLDFVLLSLLFNEHKKFQCLMFLYSILVKGMSITCRFVIICIEFSVLYSGLPIE